MSSKNLKIGFIGCHRTAEMTQLLLKQTRPLPSSIYSSTFQAAEEISQELRLSAWHSYTQLIKNSDGLVITELDWLATSPVECAVEFERSCLILANAYQQFSLKDFQLLHKQTEYSSALLMPELPYRWGRSTLRLRELIATKLQNIEFLKVTCVCDFDSEAEYMIYDWCVNLIQSECRSVKYDAERRAVRLEFRRLTQKGEPVAVEIEFAPSAANSEFTFAVAEAKAECQSGVAMISGESEIWWQQRKEASVSESLSLDRTAEEVMVDLFGRRLVGGLVPVPDLGDIVRAMQIREQRQAQA